jgi:hypothetical protein
VSAGSASSSRNGISCVAHCRSSPKWSAKSVAFSSCSGVTGCDSGGDGSGCPQISSRSSCILGMEPSQSINADGMPGWHAAAAAVDLPSLTGNTPPTDAPDQPPVYPNRPSDERRRRPHGHAPMNGVGWCGGVGSRGTCVYTRMRPHMTDERGSACEPRRNRSRESQRTDAVAIYSDLFGGVATQDEPTCFHWLAAVIKAPFTVGVGGSGQLDGGVYCRTAICSGVEINVDGTSCCCPTPAKWSNERSHVQAHGMSCRRSKVCRVSRSVTQCLDRSNLTSPIY